MCVKWLGSVPLSNDENRFRQKLPKTVFSKQSRNIRLNGLKTNAILLPAGFAQKRPKRQSDYVTFINQSRQKHTHQHGAFTVAERFW
jgi:hypothetical protein